MRSVLPIGVYLDDIVDYLRLRRRARTDRDVPVAAWSPWQDRKPPQ